MQTVKKALAALIAIAALAAGAFAAVGPIGSPGGPPTMDAATITIAFEWAINVERGERGMPALYIDQVESSQALTWSTLMAFTDTLAEDPHAPAAIAAYDPSWQQESENVGVGGTPQSIEAAFMASAPHRANILGAYTHVGVGVVVADGRIWITERFYR
jgi:uncharacterized protein YkwD